MTCGVCSIIERNSWTLITVAVSGDTSEHFTSLNFISSSHIWYSPFMWNSFLYLFILDYIKIVICVLFIHGFFVYNFLYCMKWHSFGLGVGNSRLIIAFLLLEIWFLIYWNVIYWSVFSSTVFKNGKEYLISEQ